MTAVEDLAVSVALGCMIVDSLRPLRRRDAGLLCIGMIALFDGTSAKGFLCEPVASAAGAANISAMGGGAAIAQKPHVPAGTGGIS